jgi:hypothetical protein
LQRKGRKREKSKRVLQKNCERGKRVEGLVQEKSEKGKGVVKGVLQKKNVRRQ